MDPVIVATVCTLVSIGLIGVAVAITRLKAPLYWFLVATILSGIGWAYAPRFKGFHTLRVDMQIVVDNKSYVNQYIPEIFWPVTSILIVLAIILDIIGFILLVKYGRDRRGQD